MRYAPEQYKTQGVYVWTVDLSLIAEVPSEWLTLLGADEFVRCQRFRLAKDRTAFAAAHAATRVALASFVRLSPLALRFAKNRYGKPLLMENPRCHFNLSHTQDGVAVAVAWDREIGIDIEKLDRAFYDPGLMQAVCSEAELSWLQRMEATYQAYGFLKLWTAKEAVMKAEGLGLSLPPRSVWVDSRGDTARVIGPSGRVRQCWALWHCRPTLTHLVALTLPLGSRQVVHRHLEPWELTEWVVSKTAARAPAERERGRERPRLRQV